MQRRLQPITPTLSRSEQSNGTEEIPSSLLDRRQRSLPGLFQRTADEHSRHGALIVGRTTRIADGIGHPLRQGTGFSCEFRRETL